VLLELLVALAVFAVAAVALLGVFGDLGAVVERDESTARAVDLARTRLSEIEAGLIAVEDLRPDAARAGPMDEFVTEAVLSRSAFEGLSLVEIRVIDPVTRRERFQLRQLMALPRDRARDAGESP